MPRMRKRPEQNTTQRDISKGPRQEPRPIRGVLGMQEPRMRKSVLDRRPLETNHIDPCESQENHGNDPRYMLTIKDGTLLVATARAAIESHLNGEKITPTPKAATNLTRPKGVFVTLLDYRGNQLRGCIGNPFPERPLLDQVSLMAVEGATSDPRFPPLQTVELKSKNNRESPPPSETPGGRVGKTHPYPGESRVWHDGLV